MATVHVVTMERFPREVLLPELIDMETGKIIEATELDPETKAEIVEYLVNEWPLPIRAGDLIRIEALERDLGEPDRVTEAFFVLTDQGLQPLDYEFDAVIGSLPAAYNVPAFPPNYWQNVLPDLRIIWLNTEPIADQLLANLTADGTSFQLEDGTIVTVDFDAPLLQNRAAIAEDFRERAEAGEAILTSRVPKYTFLPVEGHHLFYPA